MSDLIYFWVLHPTKSARVCTRNRHICHTDCSRCVAALLGTGDATKEKDRLHAREVKMPVLAKEQVNTTTVLHKGFTSISGERAVDCEIFQFAAPHQHRN